MTPEHLGDTRLLLDRTTLHLLDPRQPLASDFCAGLEQRLESWHKVNVGWAVFKAVTRVFQHGSTPAIDYLQQSSVLEKTFDEAEVPCARSPV